MPAGQLDFRPVCGNFMFTLIALLGKRRPLHPIKTVLPNRIGGMFFGLVLSYLFWGSLLLTRCGDVETNPGPVTSTTTTTTTSKPQTRQSLLYSASSNKGSPDPARRSSSSSGTAAPTAEPVKMTASEKFMVQEMRDMKTSINAKIDNNHEESMQKFDNLQGEVREMKESYIKLNEEVDNLRDEVRHLQEQNFSLAQENEFLRGAQSDLFMKVDDLECRSKRNNLIFHGIERNDGETPKDCEEKLQKIVTEKLGLQEVAFDRAHRTSDKKDAPIVARFVYYKQRTDILRAKKKLPATDNISINEDFSERVRSIRKLLIPFLKDAIKQKKKAMMVYDHLIIDGKKMYLNRDGSGLCEGSVKSQNNS